MTDIITAQKIVAIAKDDGIGGGKNIVAGASVNITFVGGGIAPIFADNLGTTPISLPNVTDADGEFAFFIKSGEYFYVVAGESHRVTVGIGGLPITLSDSGNMTISNAGTVVIQSPATSIKNVLTIDAPGNTAIVDLKGGGSGSNANGFIRIYSGDGTLASYIGHQGGVDFNAECVEGFSILSSQKTGAKGLIAAGNEGAIVTPNGGGTKAVLTLTAGLYATDKSTFEYDFSSTPYTSWKHLGVDYLYISSISTRLMRDGNILLNATGTATQIFSRTENIAANFDANNTQIFAPSGAPFLSATTTTATLSSPSGAPMLEASSTGLKARSTLDMNSQAVQNVRQLTMIDGSRSTYRHQPAGSVTFAAATPNRAANIQMTAAAFSGSIEVIVSGKLDGALNATGTISKVFHCSLTSGTGGAFTVSSAAMNYFNEATASVFSIGDLAWDAAALRFVVPISNIGGGASTFLATVIFYSGGATTSSFPTVSLSSIYTLTALPKNTQYPQGTWSPVVTATSGSITSYTVNKAEYTKIGNSCMLHFDFTITNAGTGSGFYNVSGCPFVCARYDAGSAVATAATIASLGVLAIPASSLVQIFGSSGAITLATGTRVAGTITYLSV